MGWMSWEIFRCNLYTPSDDCTDKSSTMCVSQALYQGQADAMVDNGFAAAGYASIHMDDVRAQSLPMLALRARPLARAQGLNPTPTQQQPHTHPTLPPTTPVLGGEVAPARPRHHAAAR